MRKKKCKSGGLCFMLPSIQTTMLTTYGKTDTWCCGRFLCLFFGERTKWRRTSSSSAVSQPMAYSNTRGAQTKNISNLPRRKKKDPGRHPQRTFISQKTLTEAHPQCPRRHHSSVTVTLCDSQEKQGSVIMYKQICFSNSHSLLLISSPHSNHPLLCSVLRQLFI